MSGLWGEKGFPQKGWSEIAVNDLNDLVGECEACGRSLRYEHIIDHPNYRTVTVGIHCCGKLMEPYEYQRSLESERDMKRKNKKIRRKFFMQKPNSFDEVQVNNGFVPADLGGHYATVKQVSEKQSSSGKDMIVVLFDFCSPDKQEGYFMESFKNDVRPDKKWPYAGTRYIMVNDYNDPNKVSKDFKAFCSAVEKSNKGFTVQWGDNWGNQFKNKKIGVVFGEVENEYDGKTTMRHEPRWFCNWDRVANAAVPDPKMLKKKTVAPTSVKAFTVDNIPEGTDEEIPF